MALAAHIFTSGSVGMIASLMGGSLLSAESCLPFAEIKNEKLHQCLILSSDNFYHLLIAFAISLDPDQARHNAEPVQTV